MSAFRFVLASLALAFVLAAASGCQEQTVGFVEGPLDSRLAGTWYGVQPAQTTLDIAANFTATWTQRVSGQFIPGAPDSIAFASRTHTAQGGAAADNTINAGETYAEPSSGTSQAAHELIFPTAATARDKSIFDDGSYVYRAHTFTRSANNLTFSRTDTLTLMGTSRAANWQGQAAEQVFSFAISGNAPSSLMFNGRTFISQGPGGTLSTGSPWVFADENAGVTETLTLFNDTLTYTIRQDFPPGSALAGQEFCGQTFMRKHNYDGFSTTGELETRLYRANDDYSIAMPEPNKYLLSVWNLDSQHARFTTVHLVADPAKQISLFGKNYFQSGGAVNAIQGQWSDGGTGLATFNDDGTFTITDGAGGTKYGHWRASSSRVYYAEDEMFSRTF